MKNRLFLTLFIAFQCAAVNELNALSLNREDTLKNDLVLVKPIINFNEPNGGFYSEYIDVELNTFFCGAIIQNCGVSSTTDFQLEFSILDYDNQVIDSYLVEYQDTLLSGSIDTLKFPEPISVEGLASYRYTSLVFSIKSDLLDDNISNNQDTVPVLIYSPDWVNISRSDTPTNSVDLSKIENFKTGDFLGMTLKITNYNHNMVYFNIYLTDVFPETSSITGKIFQNGLLINTFPIIENYEGQTEWISTLINYNWNNDYNISPNNLYYIGVELNFPEGINIPLGIDTSSFHNFEAETVARIGDSWTTLPFVPLIQLVCDPEGIKNTEQVDQFPMYPNPSNGIFTLENVTGSEIEVFTLTGKLLINHYSLESTMEIKASYLEPGNYLLRIHKKEVTFTKLFTIIR